MYRTITAVSLLLGIGLAGAEAAEYKKEDTAPCRSHPTMTLSDYLALAYDETNPLGKTEKWLPNADYRLLVPKGLKIESRPAVFYASDGVAYEYPLPAHDDEFASIGGYRYFLGEFMSPCRVQDPDGRWWVVVHHRSALAYIRGEKADEIVKPPPK